MNANEFYDKLQKDIEDSKEGFIKYFKSEEYDTYCCWITTFVHWMYWASEEECFDGYDE